MCVLIFSAKLSETFLVLRRTARDIIKKCIFVFVYSDRYIEFSRKIYETYSNIKFRKHPSRKRWIVSAHGGEDGWRNLRTDKHENNCRSPTFVYAPRSG